MKGNSGAAVVFRNEGAKQLAEGGLSLAAIVASLQAVGVTATRTTAHRWRTGEKLPGPDARAALAKAPTWVSATAWDRAPASTTAGKATARRGRPAAPAPAPAPRSSQLEDDARGEDDVRQTVADQVREALERISIMRAQADELGTPTARNHAMRLELSALGQLAKLTGESAISESSVLKHPKWRHLKGLILDALETYPEALAAVVVAVAAGEG